jgi:hypothetical protein
MARKELAPAQMKLAREILALLGFNHNPKPKTWTPGEIQRMRRASARIRRCYPNGWGKGLVRHMWPPPWRLKNVRIPGKAYFGIMKLLIEITQERKGRPRQSEKEWKKSRDRNLQTVEACLAFYDEHPEASATEVYDALGEKFGPPNTPLSRSAIRKRLGASPEAVNKKYAGKEYLSRRPWTLEKVFLKMASSGSAASK